MTIEMLTVIAKSFDQLIQAAIILFGIKAAKDFCNHWLDSFPRRDIRTKEEKAQDAEVVEELYDRP